MIYERDSRTHVRYITLCQATTPGELRALLFAISVWVLLRPTEFVDIEVLSDGTSGLSPSPRRPESLAICRCRHKSSTFSSVI